MIYHNKRRSPGVLAYHALWVFIDFVYPPFCIGCHKTGIYLCKQCLADIELQTEQCCSICGAPSQSVPCHCDQLMGENIILRSWAIYTGALREAIHRMKFKNDIGLTYFFAKKMWERYLELSWDVDLVVPVPLSRERQKERGYNQATLLARPLASLINRKFVKKALKRIRNTPSQVDLDAKDRLENVKNAFHASAKIVSNKKILLIDDIATTCATIAECSKALLNEGADKVYALTLARTIINKEFNHGDERSNIYSKSGTYRADR